MKKSSTPPRCSSVPAQKSDEIKSFPFSWDRKAPGSDDASARARIGPISGAPAPGMKLENPENPESSSSADGLKSDAVTAAANRGALVAWQNHVKKMTPAKKRLFMRENINSDSSIPQSPLSCSPVMHQQSLSPAKHDAIKSDEVTNGISTPLTTESDCEIIKPNETDDEKLKKIVTNPEKTKLEPTKTDEIIAAEKKKNPSPLPLKKRRLHAVIADARNQSVQSDASTSTASSRNQSPVAVTGVTNSSSDSDIPLAIIRKRLQKTKDEQITPASTPPVKSSPSSRAASPSDDAPKIKIRKQDFLTDASLEASLATFKRNVVTPDVTSSSSDENDDESVTRQTRARTATPPMRPRIKRTASSISSGSTALDAKELQQLAPFMLSSSEDDDDQSESESDDEYRSRAQFDSDVERRQTRSPGSVTKPKSPKKDRSPKSEQKSEKRRPAKRSLENVLKRVSDMKKATPDEIVTKRATSEESVTKKPTVEESVADLLPRKRSRKQSNAALEKFFAAEKEMDENFGAKKAEKPAKKSPKRVEPSKKAAPRKRKSNTPRKLEIVTPEETWEHSEQTVVDKNSSEGKDYLISESKFTPNISQKYI